MDVRAELARLSRDIDDLTARYEAADADKVDAHLGMEVQDAGARLVSVIDQIRLTTPGLGPAYDTKLKLLRDGAEGGGRQQQKPRRARHWHGHGHRRPAHPGHHART